jgi:hypothetical protein
MKKSIIIFIMGLWFISSPASVKAIPTVSLDILDPLIYPGETFEVNVIADGVTDVDPFWGPDELLAFGFDVIYPASFAFNGAMVGPGFFDDSALFPDTDVAGSAFPGISGDDILLATLSFTPSVAGSFSLGIFSDISDPNEGLITWLYPQIDITTSADVNVVPEPGTLLLVGSGFIGLKVLRRKLSLYTT